MSEHVDLADLRTALARGEALDPETVLDVIDDLDRTRRQLADLLTLAVRIQRRRGPQDPLAPSPLRTEKKGTPR